MRLECYCTRGGNYARNGGRRRKGGGLDRVSRAGRANSSEREREGEGESVANKRTSRRNDDGEKEETIARLFFLDSKGNDTGIRRAIVGSRRSI